MGSEVPLVAFKVLDGVVTVAVKLILRLAHDRCAGLLGMLVVRVDIVDVDIGALRLGAELRWIPVLTGRRPSMITPSFIWTSAWTI
jgi:hypothetical protein